MSNKSKNSFNFNVAAANCKKVLKSLNVKKTAALMALTTFTAASAAVLAVSATSGDVALEANLIAGAASETAVKTVIPPKEYDVRISVDGKNLGIKCAGTVNDALAAANIDIYDDDLINIGFNEPLNANTEIVVNRVNIVEEVQIETIDYATRYKEDNNYTIGYSEVVVDGEEGEVETTLRHVYIDGELVSSSVVDEDITEPVDKVVLVGTKEYNPIDDFSISQIPAPMDLTLDANGVPTSYQKVLTGKSCAYSARPGAGTASGRKATVGCVAVDPNIIPYGTELYITTTDGSAVYGYAIAADTGTALVEGQILVDLFMESYDASCDWGARQVNVYIL
ncbi:MAG: G5 domain-containing protein [Oscillospiraceae bacterium]|nr:G5 domain-containing protein [Oscillospiraceae bacterium]